LSELEVPQNMIIYANPCKEINHIHYARSANVSIMTFDNTDELLKIKLFHPTAELVLRILVDDSKSKMPFGSKFGCPYDAIPDLLNFAKILALNIIGVSFHVGSGCMDASSYSNAIKLARKVFDLGSDVGYKFTLLDIGGGFPGTGNGTIDTITFSDIALEVNNELDNSFHDVPELRIIAEPGRFFASDCGILSFNVIGKKVIMTESKEKIFHYFVNSSLYGMFNNLIFDKAVCYPKVLNENPSEASYKSVIFGQTCDSMDRILDTIELPELACGDWLYVTGHGAYTRSSASNFNGFKTCDCYYVFTY
jgi:ornithine decarboxylase